MMTCIYRAMSEAEASKTTTRPAFLKRFKWFSTDEGFIRSRVMDGKFNSSRWKPERYVHVVAFTIPEADMRQFEREHGGFVLRLDRRKVQAVRWLNIRKAV